MSQTAEISFAETKRAAPFNWNAFLAEPSHSHGQWAHAKKLATSWVTCACGNQCAALPRDIGGQPKDGILRRLGMQFMTALYENNVGEAIKVLGKIEERAQKLLLGAP